MSQAPSSRSVAKSKRQRQKEARPSEILEAAFAEFVEKGFTATRIDDVAARAGISKGTVYLYFPSKEDLFREVILHYVRPQIDERVALLKDYDGSAAELLSRHLRSIYAGIGKPGASDLVRLMMAEGPRFPELRRVFFDEMVARSDSLLRAIIDYGVTRGEFRDDGARAFPQIISGPATVSAIWKAHFEDFSPLDLDALCEAHIALALGGLLR